MQWAIVADFVVHTYSVERGQIRTFGTENLSMAFVSRVTKAEQERHYNIDFFHLNRQHDNLPKSVKILPKPCRLSTTAFATSISDYRYEVEDGETVGFFYNASPTEHYIVLNSMTVIDASGGRYFKVE